MTTINRMCVLLLTVNILVSSGFYSKSKEMLSPDNKASQNNGIPCEEIILKCTQSKEGSYIIKTEEEYNSIIKIRSPHPDCGLYKLPEIDFNKYTLLGVVIVTGGCEDAEVKYFVTKNNLQNNYLFNIEIKQIGLCKAGFRSTIWCLVPKIEKEYDVIFDVKYKIIPEIIPQDEKGKQALRDYEKLRQKNLIKKLNNH